MSCTRIRSPLQVCVKLRPSIGSCECSCKQATVFVAVEFQRRQWLIISGKSLGAVSSWSCSSIGSSSSLFSCSSSLWSSSSSAAFPMLIKDETALFAARPRASIFANNDDWQSGQVLISGNVHWTWKDCPHTFKIFQIGLSFVQSGKSHFLWLRLRD